MTSVATRSSVMAIVVESTEGTLKAPSAATEYTKMQDDFSFDRGTTSIENVEKSGTIGKSKPVIGVETPTISFGKYLRGSGTEGTAPDYNDLLKAFWGTETVNSTQRTMTSGSAVGSFVLAAGGSDFARGAGVLLKDGVNGYRIRAIHSVSSNTLTPGFNVPGAPASGVTVGKCIYYSPAQTGHQTLSIWHYGGNGGVVEAMAGGRVSEFSFTAKAGDAIAAQFNIEGTSTYLNPIEITSATRYIDFTNDDATYAAAITVKTYRDPHDLAAALTAAMNAVATGETATVTYNDSTGKFLIVSTGTLLSLLFNTGTNTANTIATKIGFAVADATGTAAGTGYSSATAVTLTSPYTPTFDSADMVVGKNLEVMIGDATDYACFEASQIGFKGTDAIRFIQSLCAESGRSGSVVSERMATLTVTALLDKYDAEFFKRYRLGTTTRFQFSFGQKDGGNWVPGACGYLYLPAITVTSFNISDDDGLFTLELELTPYVDSSGNGEMYLGFL